MSWAQPLQPASAIEYLSFDVLGVNKVCFRRALAVQPLSPIHSGVIPLRYKLAKTPFVKAKPAPTEAFAVPFGIRAPKSTAESTRPLRLESDDGLAPPNPSSPALPPPRPSQNTGSAAAKTEVKNAEKPEPVITVDDDADHDGGEQEEELPEKDGDPSHMASGQVGIVSFEAAAPTDKSRCFVCASAGLPQKLHRIPQGSAKLFYRVKKGQVEKSVHVGSVTNGNLRPFMGPPHVAYSTRFLVNLLNTDLDLKTRQTLTEALDALPASEPSSSSGAAPAAAPRPLAAATAASSAASSA